MPVVICPKCGRETEYEGNEHRPFCSERCKLLDFGAWADGDYNIPAVETELSEEESTLLERVRQQGTDDDDDA